MLRDTTLSLTRRSADLYINGCIDFHRAVPWCREELEFHAYCRVLTHYTNYLRVLTATWGDVRYVLVLRELPSLLAVRTVDVTMSVA